MYKNFADVKIHAIVLQESCILIFNEKQTRKKKKVQREQINQTISYSNTATESILILEFASFAAEALGQWQRNFSGKVPCSQWWMKLYSSSPTVCYRLQQSV